DSRHDDGSLAERCRFDQAVVPAHGDDGVSEGNVVSKPRGEFEHLDRGKGAGGLLQDVFPPGVHQRARDKQRVPRATGSQRTYALQVILEDWMSVASPSDHYKNERLCAHSKA